ncbi:MAG: hypothetical protein HYY65_14210 [Candidatus Tectomicrobia bacterium]|uniref:DUF2059 domain-containing protein n=1 Tax=Tectimicrobiota bacterium TaxID=2528274 RepID=A0A932M257_UNCTE|nr:hypothetical protein [Candidatus Tectomicrobia bacterium]
MRAVQVRCRWWLMVLLAAVAVGASGARAQEAAEGKRALIAQMLDLAGMKSQIGELGEIIASAAEQYQGRLSVSDRKRVTDLIAGAYAVEKVYPGIIRAFEKEYDPSYMTGAMNWLQSPLGRKMSALEVQAATQNSPEQIMGFNTEYRRLSEGRRAAIDRLANVLKAGDVLVNTVLITTTEMVMGMQAELPADKKINEQQMRAGAEGLRNQLRGRYQELARVSIAYTYRSLSDEELEQGTLFYTTEAGQWLNRVGNDALVEAMGQSAREVGKGLGVILRERRGVKS